MGSFDYHLVIKHSHGKSPFLIGKPSINGPFSVAMLNNQMVLESVSIGMISEGPFLVSHGWPVRIGKLRFSKTGMEWNGFPSVSGHTHICIYIYAYIIYIYIHNPQGFRDNSG